MSKDKSPHASISFTAHYTGEMWQKLGLSHPALATTKGKRLHHLLTPLEAFAKLFFGVSIGKTLTVRHHLIDKRIKAFINAHPDAQIVEIAAGLSPRGWRFLKHYLDISYTEVDLPAMSMLKQTRARDLPAPVPAFFAADLLADDLTPIFDTLDANRPLLIVSEGLINYFSLDMLGQLSQRLAAQAAKFSTGMWLTENYPYSNKSSYNALVKVAGATLGALSKSDFSFYFYTPAEATDFFTQHGFQQSSIFQPSQEDTAENHQHLGDTVWIIELYR